MAPRRGASGLPKYDRKEARAKLGVMMPESLIRQSQPTVLSGAEKEDALSVEEASNAQEDGREERLAQKAFLLHPDDYDAEC